MSGPLIGYQPADVFAALSGEAPLAALFTINCAGYLLTQPTTAIVCDRSSVIVAVATSAECCHTG
jgi:hypothetical protein